MFVATNCWRNTYSRADRGGPLSDPSGGRIQTMQISVTLRLQAIANMVRGTLLVFDVDWYLLDILLFDSLRATNCSTLMIDGHA